MVRQIDGHGGIEEVDVESGAAADCRAGSPRERRPHFGPLAMVLHGFRIVARIGQHYTVAIDDGDAGAQFGVGVVGPWLEIRWREGSDFGRDDAQRLGELFPGERALALGGVAREQEVDRSKRDGDQQRCR